MMTMPTLAPQTIVDWLQALSFEAPSPGHTAWFRTFAEHALTITVDTSSGIIEYGPEIKVGRRTTTNLDDLENLVVLECVTSLLARGYKPASLELEVPFQLGRKAGGYLDILVRRNLGTYMMIECKTAGVEFTKEKQRLLSTARNQLLSYLQQDRSTEQVILYSSSVESSGKILREYVGFSAAGIAGVNTTEIFSNWDKQLYDSGLFDSDPYLIVERQIKMSDLRELSSTDSLALFNSFKEILRRHAVSDLPNAFNKLFNLIICKILDEDKSGDQAIAEFQWGGNEDDSTVLDRLSSLYERGMRDFLKLDVIDTHARVADAVASVASAQADELTRLLAELRQYSNTDFAFVDVFDKKSFDQNASIVRELVRLLQTRRLRYAEKHDFMGLFFERLLHTSMKQEAGQFFTPPPVAQFVNESLPIEQIVARKIEAKDPNFLPYGIDYAAGSGHFLTEYMARVDRVLRILNANVLVTKTQERNAATWATAISWAGEFVYGLELDHRLAKTAKIATFLHGDGDANMLRANGLAHFGSDPDFEPAGVRLHGSPSGFDHQMFDVVVANPPYSIPGFAQALKNGAESFELWPVLTEKTDDIESLFVERTKHILVDGGVAGIILPTSILTNSGVESHARAILLKYFQIVSIVSLGDNVFIATDTPCIILFLRRRPNSIFTTLESHVSAFVLHGTTGSIAGNATAIEDYAESQFGLTADELYSALSDPYGHQSVFDDYHWQYASSRKLSVVPDTVSHRKALKALVHSNESAKMVAFFLTANSETVVVNAPTSRRENTRFLGYSFSVRRRHEGIRYQSGTNMIDTPLYDPADTYNPTKISTFIRAAFESKVSAVPAGLDEWVSIRDTRDLVALDESPFDWKIRLSGSSADRFKTPSERLGALFSLKIGATPTRERPDYFAGSLPWLKISDLGPADPSHARELAVSDEMITAEAASTKPGMMLLPVGTLVMSFKLTIGRVARTAVPAFTNEAIVALMSNGTRVDGGLSLSDVVLEILIRRVGHRLLGLDQVGDKKFGRTLNLRMLERLRVPIFSDADLDRIVEIDRDVVAADDDKASAIASLIWD